MKSIEGLSVQLGTHVPSACTHVSMAPYVRAIMELQDVWANYTVNACKTCGQTATLWLQSNAVPVDNLQGTATVSGDLTGQCHTTGRVQRGRRQDKAYPMLLKTSFATPSH
jgi:hypothetical protein